MGLKTKSETTRNLILSSIVANIDEMEKYVVEFLWHENKYTKIKDVDSNAVMEEMKEKRGFIAFCYLISEYQHRIKIYKELIIENDFDKSLIEDLSEIKKALKTILRSQADFIKKEKGYWNAILDNAQISEYNKNVTSMFQLEII